MAEQRYFEAIEDFRRAHSRAALQVIMGRLTGRSAELLSYESVRQKLGAREAGPQELGDIPLEAIVGSVGRYTDFTRTFLPRLASDGERWVRVQGAMTSATGVPPIDVYQIGDVYFVKDGNHRVSVARQLGSSHIEAYVTPVRTKVPFSMDTQPDELILKAEYVDFLEHTRLDILRPDADLAVTVPGRYEEIEQHIEVQRFLMSVDLHQEIPYEEAVTHWYDEFYLPVVRVIREQGVLRDFPGRTETDLYIWTMRHRVALERELGWEIETGSAAADLVTQFSPQPRRIIDRIRRRIVDTVTPEGLEAGPPPGTWRSEHTIEKPSDRLFADILLAIDGEENGWRALQCALELARQEEGRLHGLHVVRSEAQRESKASHAVEVEFNRRCNEAGIPATMTFAIGDVARQVYQRSRWMDLVVLSLGRPSASRMVSRSYPFAPRPLTRLGSGLRTVIRRSSTPALVVPGNVDRIDRLLLAYDGSPKAEEALFVATALAGRWNIPLVMVTVMEGDRTTSDTMTYAHDYLETHGVDTTYIQATGPIAAEITITAEEHDCNLIVIGGHGHSPMVEIVLGSAVDEVLRTTRRPVLICR